jgi:hypothetical protein
MSLSGVTFKEFHCSSQKELHNLKLTKVLPDARPHLGKVVTDLLSKYEWEVLPHVPYSPDMSPPDFDLFHKLK